MAYQRTTWRTEETPLSAPNMNNIEDGIEEALQTTRNISSVVGDMFASILAPLVFGLVYPVGSYYYTSDANFDPNTAWGGTWSKLGEGQVLLSAGSTYQAGTVYGANTKSYTPAGTVGNHKLTTAEIPAHTHGSKSLLGHFNVRKWNGTGHTVTYADGIMSMSEPSSGTGYPTAAMTGTNPKVDQVIVNATHEHASVGGSGNHNHPFTGTAATLNVMQKSTAAYIWHRTA